MTKPKPTPKTTESKGYLAAILLRGLIHTRHDIRQALDYLRLRKKHVCVLLPNTTTYRGMLTLCKDYLTWGEIQTETLKELDQKRKKNEGKLPHYHLAPPRGGFERRGIKKSHTEGGALGYRGDQINELIKKMI